MKKSLGLFQHNRKAVRRRTSGKLKKGDYGNKHYNRDRYEDDYIEDDKWDEDDDRYDERDEDDDRYDERDEDDNHYDERDEDDDRYDGRDKDYNHYDERDEDDNHYDERDEDDDRYDGRDKDHDRYDERDEDDNRYDERDEDDDRYDEREEHGERDEDDYYDDEYDDYEDEEDDYEDREEYHSGKQNRSKGRRKKGKVAYFLKKSNAIERVALLAGGIVLAVGISVGTIFVQVQARNRELASFKEVGSQLNGVQVIGQSGLLAVADAQQAKMAASDAVSDAADSASTEDANAEVRVRIALATIKKDLKIKFINRESGKLIANVPFTVKVEGPKGTDTYNDDDMDGIIYKSDIPAGTYTVTAQPLDSQYGRYEISADAQKIAVKDTITYKKVDVQDEIKTEAQVNVAKEDTQVQNTPVESVKKDTVEWVESTKTEVGTDDSTTAYSAIDKSTITDPSASARLNIKGLSRFDGSSFSISGTSAMTVDDEQILNPLDVPSGATIAWASDNNNVVLVDTKGKVKAVSEGKATITATCNYTKTSSESTTMATTIKDAYGNVSATTATTTKDVQKNQNDQAMIVITVSKKAEAATYSLTPVTASVAVGGTVQLTASSTNLSDTKVTWSSANTSVATVSDAGLVTAGKTAGTAVITAKYSDGTTKTTTITVTETKYTITSVSIDKSSIAVGGTAALTAVTDPTGGTATWTCDKTAIATVKDTTVTGVAAGTATLTATCGSSTKTLTLTVTSDKGAVTLSPTKLTLLTGKNATLTATATDLSDKTVTWASSDGSVATVSSTGKVTAVKAGTATITATSNADKTKAATCAVTVADSASVLKDKNGNTVYILDKNGKYVQATYADYDTASKFYVQTAGKKYKYTGWQTIDGKTYFYDKDGNVVTGDQTIQGAKYTFGSDGALQSGSGNMGIDVSKWNGNIDWAAVKNSGVSFVIIRCGYRGSSTGALIEDPKFRNNIKGATNAGIKVGVYFFTQAISDVEAVEEASMVADLCSGYSLSYPVYLDVEGSNGRGDAIDAGTRTAVCKAFCATMANAGYGTGVYSNKTWLTSRINTSSLTGYKIWLAQYAANPTYSATRYDMWQYTSKGAVTGITGNVDLNICY